MNEVFVGDVGTEVILDCGTDISTATVVKVIAKTPKGVKKQWVGSVFDVTNIRYVLAEGDVDKDGTWELQAYVEMPGWKGRGLWTRLEVKL